MKLAHVVSMSGGKDSTATKLEAIDRGVETINVFADTGHEHTETYEYLDYLEIKLGHIRRVKADFSRRIEIRRRNLPELWRKNAIPESRIDRALELLHSTGIPFLDLCMLKWRFPSARRRFCSQELKHVPIRTEVVDPLMDEGYTVVSWQGVRADESRDRAKLDIVEQPEEDLIVYRPIITWTADDVFKMHRRHGIKWNPLYEQGIGRVGCMPCINARKNEIREIANRFPEEIERVTEWENLVSEVSKRGLSTMFSFNKTPDGKNATIENPCQAKIASVIKWSKTSRGGRNYDIFLSAIDDQKKCSSIYGLCE